MKNITIVLDGNYDTDAISRIELGFAKNFPDHEIEIEHEANQFGGVKIYCSDYDDEFLAEQTLSNIDLS